MITARASLEYKSQASYYYGGWNHLHIKEKHPSFVINQLCGCHSVIASKNFPTLKNKMQHYPSESHAKWMCTIYTG